MFGRRGAVRQQKALDGVRFDGPGPDGCIGVQEEAQGLAWRSLLNDLHCWRLDVGAGLRYDVEVAVESPSSRKTCTSSATPFPSVRVSPPG